MATNDKANFIAQYETAFSDAVKKLGKAKEGHVWLFRAEHIVPHPYGTSPEALDQEKKAVGRWYGPNIGGRFEHIDRRIKMAQAAGIDPQGVRISAIEVPNEVASACYMTNVDVSRRKDGEAFSELQYARHTYGTAKTDAAFFFPPNIENVDTKQLMLANKVTKFGQGLFGKKQTLIEIPMADFGRLSPEEWQGIGHKVDAAYDLREAPYALKLHNIGANIQR